MIRAGFWKMVEGGITIARKYGSFVKEEIHRQLMLYLYHLITATVCQVTCGIVPECNGPRRWAIMALPAPWGRLVRKQKPKRTRQMRNTNPVS